MEFTLGAQFPFKFVLNYFAKKSNTLMSQGNFGKRIHYRA